MTTNRLHSDDPRLTAYALGELDLAERAAIERELSLRPELRAEVEQIQRTAGLLARALEAEPVADLTPRDTSGAKKPRRAMRKWVAAVCVAVSAAIVLLLLLPPALQPPVMQGRWGSFADDSRSMIVAEGREAAERTAALRSKSSDLSLQPDREQTSVSWHSPTSLAARSPAAVSDPQPARRASRPDEFRHVLGAEYQSAEHFDRTQQGQQSKGAVAHDQLRGRTTDLYGKGVLLSDGSVRMAGVPIIVGEGLEQKQRVAPPMDEDTPHGVPGTESYNAIVENPFIAPEGEQALSTFSIDVDTASYSNVRRFLKHGQLPPRDAVRIEELVNYFDYSYPQPPDGVPFSVTTEFGPCPWQPEHRLVRIGLKGREIEREQRPVSNLVFLLDVSGSMQPENKLPLVKAGMELLVEQLNENDRISIVTYAGNAGLVLEPTSGDDKETILSAIRSLQAGGSTNGEAGIKLAYTQAIKNFTEHGANRVILCTDGDFNVGVSSDDELVTMIQEKAKQSRVYLSIFGFGMGNLKDAKLEQLANKGNGHYGYIDDVREARKVFSEELMGTLYTIAKDVKIQVEFNPQRVGAYRLIGYENRALATRDFTDDTKDAGEIGAGHTVTALYEVAPVGKAPGADTVGLKYQKPEGRSQESGVRGQGPEEFRNELLTVKLRYKLPDADSSVPLEFPLVDDPGRSLQASRDFDWAAAVAAFGMVLRDSRYKGQANLDLVRELAQGALGPQPSESRREFLDLIDAARSLIKPGEQEGTRR